MRTRSAAVAALVLLGCSLLGVRAQNCEERYGRCGASSDCCDGYECYELMSSWDDGMCMLEGTCRSWTCVVLEDDEEEAAPPSTPWPTAPPTPSTPWPTAPPPPPVTRPPTAPPVTAPPATAPPPPPPTPPATPPQTPVGDCSIYGAECGSTCGDCFNPGSRPGFFIDQDKDTGYYNQDKAYACMDWSFGSKEMMKGEEEFRAATGDNVYLGVGTFGATSQISNLGSCYRMTVKGVDRDIIVQAINTGGDVAGNQFDLQMGSGGFGIFNRCVGDPDDMFAGPASDWGQVFGGTDLRADCSKLPQFPRDETAMRVAGDDLVKLCEYGFDKGVRREPMPGQSTNPTITDLKRVKCPSPIVELTQLQRSDDPADYKVGTQMPGFPNTQQECQGNGDWGNMAFCLTRMLDCKKPSASFIDNIDKTTAVPGKKVVQPCLIDGYTRIDVQCGCSKCWC